MNPHHEIVESNEADRTVTARYWTDLIGLDQLDPQRNEDGSIKLRPDGRYARVRTDTSIGVPPNLVISPQLPGYDEQAVLKFIEQFIPREWFQILEDRLQGNSQPLGDVIGVTSSLEQAVIREVQFRLDGMARMRGYDNIVSLCSYATSKVEQFAREAQHGVDVRDAAWAHCYQIMAAVVEGTRSVPTIGDVLAEMPTMDWSDFQ